MKDYYLIKRNIVLFSVLLIIICWLSPFVWPEVAEGGGENKTEESALDISKQIFILNAVQKAEEKVNELKNGSLEDERADSLLLEIKSIFEMSNYILLIEELNNINRTIPTELMHFINKGLSLKKKPADEDYDNAIELKSSILERVDFIYELKEKIKNFRWKTNNGLFWNSLSVEVDLSPLNLSQELFNKGEYDKAGEIFERLNKEIELKSYQDVEKKKGSLGVVLECEKILENIEKEGFEDDVAEDILKQTKDFFKSKNFYSLIERIEDIEEPSWGDAKELLNSSGSSSERPINEDYEKLIEFKEKAAKRKEKLEYIKAFIENLGERLEKDKAFKELETELYLKRYNDAKKLFTDNKYDQAFEEALSIEVELEDKTIKLIIESSDIIKKLNSSNFSILYLSDLLRSVYDKFAPFQPEELLKIYEKSGEKEKIIFVNSELIPVKNSMEGGEEYYRFVDFGSIIGTINEIKYREDQIYRIDESIKSLSKKIEDYSAKGIISNVSETKLGEAVSKFASENYDDAESSLFEANTKLELARARLTVLSVLSVEGLSFLQMYKYHIIITIILLSIISFFSWTNFRVRLLTKRLNNSRMEKDTLENLIKRVQKEHFADGTMPTSIYNIKYEEYTQRINTVKATIPVQETVLAKQIRFNKKVEGPILKTMGFIRGAIKKTFIPSMIKKIMRMREKRVKKELKRGEHKEVKKGLRKESKEKGRENEVILSKGIKDIIATISLSGILVGLLYLINVFPDSFLRYSILILCFSFFIVFTAILTQRETVIPLAFIIIALATMKIGVFDVKGAKLIYIFAAVGALFLLLFYVFILSIKRYNTSAIISSILAFAIMPLIMSVLVSFNITKISLYEILNISLINLLLSALGAFIALVVWYNFRTMEFMLRMGY